MENTTWLRQVKQPLYKDLLWSRPENKKFAGKLLVVGGNTQSFNATSVSSQAAIEAGIGMVRVLLPNTLEKLLAGQAGGNAMQMSFAASNVSGGFSKLALSELIENSNWADGVLLAGDFGHNSETGILLEQFVTKYTGLLTIADDGLDYFMQSKDLITDREKLCISVNFSQLQKFSQHHKPGLALKSTMSLYELTQALSSWTAESKLSFAIAHESQIIVASTGRVSTTPAAVDTQQLAGYAATWSLQHVNKTFEALTCEAWDISKSK
jgi:hypothetical protein